MGLPMVLLMYRQRTFCQFFLSSDTRKLMAYMMLVRISPSVMPTLATATPMHSTFFSWNLMLHLVSSTCAGKSKASAAGQGGQGGQGPVVVLQYLVSSLALAHPRAGLRSLGQPGELGSQAVAAAAERLSSRARFQPLASPPARVPPLQRLPIMLSLNPSMFLH